MSDDPIENTPEDRHRPPFPPLRKGETAAELREAILRLGGAPGLPMIFPPLPDDDDGVIRHVCAMHRITVPVGDALAARARRLHEDDHRAGAAGHLHESREQPGDRRLPPIRLDFPERRPRDHYRVYGREEFRRLPGQEADLDAAASARLRELLAQPHDPSAAAANLHLARERLRRRHAGEPGQESSPQDG